MKADAARKVCIFSSQNTMMHFFFEWLVRLCFTLLPSINHLSGLNISS